MRRVALALLALAFAPAVVEGAQVGRGGDPQSRLRLEAATLESRGDLDGAELALRRLLDLDPTSAGTIFALERVLRAKGELDELHPLVESFLATTSSLEVMALELRLLAEADSIERMVAEAERWLTADGSEAAYREVARAYGLALGNARALEVLRRGRAAIGTRDALALEIGDALVAGGDVNGAIAEYAQAVGDGARVDAVVARVRALGDGAQTAARVLAQNLGESDVRERRDAALSVALALDLEPEALALARREADDLEGRARTTYLERVGARAQAAALASVAAWAYGELGGQAETLDERRQFERRIVDVALEAGDTTIALQAQRRVAASYARSSEEGRRAQAEVVRLEASAYPDRVAASWQQFRTAFPDAPELDEVAAAIAMSLQARGNAEGAADVLEGIEGPRSTLERGYLLLAGGQIEEGRQTLLVAVGGLPPVDATGIIQFSSLLGRLSEGGARALVTAGVAAHRGQGGAAGVALAAQTAALPVADQAPLLAEAARMADRGALPDRAAEMRLRLVTEHPDAMEAAEAALLLARHIGRPGGDEVTAIRLLEDLITRRPNAAIVPEARLELERLRSRGS